MTAPDQPPARTGTRDAANSAARDLLVLASGVGPTAIGSAIDLRAVPGGGVVALDRTAAEPIAEIAAVLPVDPMHTLELEIERRSLALRPPWRGDAQAIELLARRPFGPAPLSLLHLRDPLVAAAAHGVGSAAHLAAVAACADGLRRCRALLDAPRLWFAALGEPVGVTHMLDVLGIVRAALGRSLARGLRADVAPERATLWLPSARAHDLLRRELPATALAGATVLPTGPCELLLLAPPCSAFGRGRIFARAGHGAETTAAVLMPILPRTRSRLDTTQLLARVLLAAAANVAETRRPRPTPAVVAADEPALLPLHDRRAHVDATLLADPDAPRPLDRVSADP